MTDIASLNIRINTLEAKVAKQDLDRLTGAGQKAEHQMETMSKAAARLGAALAAAMAAAVSVQKISAYIKEATLLNARYETLGVVLNQVGKNAGYSNKMMSEFETGLKKAGIAGIEARTVLTRMTQAQIDLTQSTKLARIAQDAAVIGNINSSEAFERMIHGIQSAQIDVLRTIGINVNFEQSYKKLADEIGVATTELSENQKMQARVNVVMEAGTAISGVYTAAMNTAGKQLASMKRYTDELKISTGELFNEAFTNSIWITTETLKGLNAEFARMKASGELDAWASRINTALYLVLDTIAIIARTFTLAGKSAAAAFALMNMLAWDLTDVLINGPIKALQNIIDMYNAIPMMPDIEMPRSITSFGKTIGDEADLARRTLKAASEDLIAFFKDADVLPSTKIKEHIKLIKELEKAADETIKLTKDKTIKLTKEELAALEKKKKITLDFLDEYKKATLSAFEYEIYQLNKEYDYYEKYIDDKVKLEEWYSARMQEIYTQRVDDALSLYFREIDHLQEDLIKSQEEYAKAVEDAHADMRDTIQDHTADIVADWDSAGDMLVNIAKRTAATMAAAFLTQQFIMPMVQTIGGSMGMNWNGVPVADMAQAQQVGMGLPSGNALSWIGNNVPGMGALGSAMAWNMPGTGLTVNTASAAASLGVPQAGTSFTIGGTSLGTALGYGAIGGLGYRHIGGAFGLPQGGYSGVGASLGGAVGGAYGGAAASALGVKLGMAGGPLGMAVGAILGGLAGSLFGGSKKEPKVGLISGTRQPGDYGYGYPGEINSKVAGYHTWIQDVEGSDSRSEIGNAMLQVFDAQFQAIEDATSWGLKEALAGTSFESIAKFKDHDNDLTKTFTAMSDDVFKQINQSLVSAMGLSSVGLDTSFFEGLRADGETLLQTFARFATIAESIDDFSGRMDQQMSSGKTAEEAFANLSAINEVVEAMSQATEQLSTSSAINTIRGLITAQDEYLESLKAATATESELAQIQVGIAQQIGASISGLTANSLQSVLASGGDITGILQATVKNTAAQTIAGLASESIMAEYGNSLNQLIGDAFKNINAEDLNASDLTDALNDILTDFDWEGLESAAGEAAAAIKEFAGAGADFAATAKARAQLEIQIMELEGDAVGALAAQRQIEINSMDATLRPLQEYIYAMQDTAAAASSAASSLASSQAFNASLGDKYAELTLSSYELELRNAGKWYEGKVKEAEGLDIDNALLEKVYDLQKEAIHNKENERIAAQERAAQEASARAAEASARAAAQAASNAAQAAQKIRDIFKDIVDDLQATRESLSMTSGVLDPFQAMGLAKNVFDRQYQQAMTGDQDSLKGLSGFAKEYADAARSMMTNSQEYADIIGSIQQQLYMAQGVALSKANGYAAGGISSGPLSGHYELLHGTEAIIPLNGQSIPLKIDNTVFNEMVGLLKMLLNTTGDNKVYLKRIDALADRLTQGGDAVRTTEVAA